MPGSKTSLSVNPQTWKLLKAHCALLGISLAEGLDQAVKLYLQASKTKKTGTAK